MTVILIAVMPPSVNRMRMGVRRVKALIRGVEGISRISWRTMCHRKSCLVGPTLLPRLLRITTTAATNEHGSNREGGTSIISKIGNRANRIAP